MARELTEKQRRFVEAYMGAARGNATEAAAIAGYRGNRVTLQAIGKENLGKPLIRQALAERQSSDPLILTREDRQRELSRIAMGSEDEHTSDRLRAIDLLNKMGGDYLERIQHEGGDQTIVIEWYRQKNTD